MNDKQFLQRAIDKAKESAVQGGFPAGVIVVFAELENESLAIVHEWERSL